MKLPRGAERMDVIGKQSKLTWHIKIMRGQVGFGPIATDFAVQPIAMCQKRTSAN